MLNNRRSELDIVVDILNLSKDGTNKTSILYKTNLSYSQLKNYLSILLEKDILKEVMVEQNGRDLKHYKTTSKGLNLLELSQEITNLLE
ncbi:MAG: winged helix-turn-helix domain-containing protein [Candidatus Thermoplasmatota archaeon]|nr:winged helix-turn-helix domain-containing protein [Candidatus Thermoplasmatota archaeon]